MKHLIKTVSFLSIMAVFPGVFAATSRVSVMGSAASRRLPSIAGYVKAVSVIGGTTTSSTTGSLDVSECMDEYSECVRQEDVCGENFEECTTNVLFHLQMPKCESVLLRCNTAGVSMLFGTPYVTDLSTVDYYVRDDNDHETTEVGGYKYPSSTSRLGEWIQTAWKVNSLDAQQCSKKYTTCLKRDSVCGADFELCTSQKEFKKQAVFCASTLARCSVDGKRALFGSTVNADNLSLADKESAVAQMVVAGAGLAAGNAVNTCYKVADQCILKACGKNPSRCMIDRESAIAEIAEYVESGTAMPADKLAELSARITARDKKAFIKNMCLDAIGNNKYCYMTHVANGETFKTDGGKAITPDRFEELAGKLSELERQELFEEVYEDIYEVRMKTSVGQRIADLMAEYDAKTRDKCLNTIRSCVMQTCGGGIGSVCYSQVFKHNTSKHINAEPTYSDIKTGCQALINSDPSCQYSAAVSGYDGYWTINGTDDTFGAVFPSEGGSDLLGAVAALEGELATSYNDAAIDKMKKQCATTAISCVKSMCGKDYSNCFRNRTDITAGVYDTGSGTFDTSMNKQAGILDYNIVTGLCVNTVKNAKVCEEHLKIEADKYRRKLNLLGGYSITWGTSPSWGTNNDVRSAWLDSADGIVIGCRVNSENALTDDCKNNNNIEKCGTVDDSGCVYDEEVTQSNGDYLISNAANSLFQETLMDLEKEAQAKYSARLTKEQNICLANNKGGIKGEQDNGSTFAWVKLNGKSVPGSYAQKGLKISEFKTSNDIYGSFCRARVTVESDDKAINDKLGEDAVAYFAVGDAFECGSWIDSDKWDEIEKEVRKGQGMSSWKKNAATWWSAAGGVLLGGTAGALAGNYLANGKIGGNGLLNKDAKNTANNKTNAGSCVNNLNRCLSNNNDDACRAGLRDARAAGINVNLTWNSKSTNLKCEANEYATEYTWCSGTMKDDDCGQRTACCEWKEVKEDGETVSKRVVKHHNKCVYNGKAYNVDEVMRTGVNVAKIEDEQRTQIEDILQQCQDNVQNNNSSGVATGVGGLLGAAAGGVLGYGIAKTVIDAKDNQAKDKALAEWQSALGEHIRCYVGGEDVGGYGDYVSFNFE